MKSPSGAAAGPTELVRFEETWASRRWVSRYIFERSVHVLLRVGPVTAVLAGALAAAGRFGYINPRLVAYMIVAVVTPALIILGMALISPLWLLPGRWVVTTTGLQARGYLEFGRISWADVESFECSEAEDLPGHTRIRIKWNSGLGCAGTWGLYLPPSVPAATLRQLVSTSSTPPSTGSSSRANDRS